MSFVKTNVDLAIRAAHEVNTENTMNRPIGTIRRMSSIVAGISAGEKADLPSFIHLLQDNGKQTQPSKLKAGFGDTSMGTASALQLIMLHLECQTLGDIRQGPVSYPRLGRLVERPSTGRSRDVSRIFFNLDGSSQPAQAARGDAKHCALWIASKDAVDVVLQKKDFRACSVGSRYNTPGHVSGIAQEILHCIWSC